MRPRTSARAAVVTLVLATGVSLPWGSASGSCAGPELTLAESSVAEPVVRPGAALTVHGARFVDGCDDGGGSSTFGCSSPEREVERAEQRVLLELVQGDRRWELGSADASTAATGRFGQVVWDVRLPAAVRRGPAILEAGNARLPVLVARP